MGGGTALEEWGLFQGGGPEDCRQRSHWCTFGANGNCGTVTRLSLQLILVQ